MNKTVLERFEDKFTKGPGCWNWTASFKDGRYGSFRLNGPAIRAHRASYNLYIGPIPNGWVVCHDCNNTKCVNPGHLYLGTQQDNIAQMVREGRQARGEKKKDCKLTTEQVREIKYSLKNGTSNKVLALTYKVDPSTISHIKGGRKWKHVI